MIRKALLIGCLIAGMYKVFGAYLINIPQTITQPDGQNIHCFITGDEYYHWLHDENNYTIIQDEKTGYYTYAIQKNNEIKPSKYIVGIDNAEKAKLTKGINISCEKIRQKRHYSDSIKMSYLKNYKVFKAGFLKSTLTRKQNLNNLVIYIRFSDQTEFPAIQAQYTNEFNNTTTGAASVYNYFKEGSYNQLLLTSTFYPTNNGTSIVSYQDSHSLNYYAPKSVTNPDGYLSEDPNVPDNRYEREQNLLKNAIDYCIAQIPSGLDLDYDSDGNVDNICFILRDYGNGSSITIPHAHYFFLLHPQINGLNVFHYTIQLEKMSDLNVICHELLHTLGAPDLYDYTVCCLNPPVWHWDVLAELNNPPQSTGVYIKYRYLNWITAMPVITASGTYTLNPITSATNNCYRINSKRSSTDFFVIEFRRKSGTFEGSIPGTGLVIYKINTLQDGKGNSALPYEVYVYRKDGSPSDGGSPDDANFSIETGRTAFNNTSNPYCFLSDGSLGYIFIKNIKISGNTATFDVRFCDGDNISYSNTDQLPAITNASNKIETSANVTVKSYDNVIFEAGQEIFLDKGFKVQQYATFEINMNGCGEK